MRKRYRGNYCGLTLTLISELMGCTRPTARKYLKVLVQLKGDIALVTLDDIGELAHRYREVTDLERLRTIKMPAAQRVMGVVPGMAMAYEKLMWWQRLTGS